MVQKHKSARDKFITTPKLLFVTPNTSVEATFPRGASVLTKTEHLCSHDSSP